MRDRRFVARHRGGPLGIDDHRALAAWAADCAEHVLHLFEDEADDDRPRRAVEVARAWARGEVPVGDAQKAAWAAHAAAREVESVVATEVARATGHAVATAHMADHSLGGAVYALRAIRAAGGDVASERAWQSARIPEGVRSLVLSALASERLRRLAPATGADAAGRPGA